MKNTLLWLIGIAVAGGAVYMITRKTPAQKRKYLLDTQAEITDQLRLMSDDEIVTVYTLIVDYYDRNKMIPAGSDLEKKMEVIGKKYNIFT